jgi:hypothetical protein
MNGGLGRPSYRDVQTTVDELRLRLHEYRGSETPLWQWRELQLEILGVARRLARAIDEEEPVVQPDLWNMLGEAFWLEADTTRLVSMIEEVLTELASHGSPGPESAADGRVTSSSVVTPHASRSAPEADTTLRSSGRNTSS